MSNRNKFTKDLSKVSTEDREKAGSKAINLALLLNNGFPVPEGFVVLSDCFDEFMENVFGKSDWGPKFKTIVAEHDHQRRDAIFLQWKKAALSQEINEEISKMIQTMAKAYEIQKWAVRSSSTLEDTSQYAFAGQFDSFLNVDLNNITEYIRKCWISFISPRVISYRRLHNIDTTGKMAVIIQRMVDAKYSGVIFTASKQADGHILIEIAQGVGGVVAGEDRPDNLFLDRETLEIIRSETMLGLNRADFLKLAAKALQIEKLTGSPQDIEFCVEKNKIWFLQTRPITA